MMRGRRQAASSVATVALWCLCAHSAAAVEPRLALDATPLLGSSATEDGGWRTLLVRLENPTARALSGSVEVESRPGWARGSAELVTSVPFSLAPGAKVSVEVPTHGFGGGSPALLVSARDGQNNQLGEITISGLKPADALVFDLATPSHVATLLRGSSFASRRGSGYASRIRAVSLGVSSASEDPTTGDLVLPALPAGYNPATLVIGSGRDLSRLDETARVALSDWLLSGGALALALDRPEDLANPLLEAMAGGHITRGRAPESLQAVTQFLVPSDEPPATSVGSVRLREVRLAPSSEVVRRFAGYTGGNLSATPWGASASYGLGELHLLSFDPRDALVARDPWVKHKLADLARHAFDREPQATVRHSTIGNGDANLEQVRRELDPNQTSRWTIAVSALVLLLYAAGAGPLSFYLAARKGRPLRALWQLPLWSAATFLVIVLCGVLGKGVSGRARKLSLFDLGAGMTRAAALRFRGFYAPSSRELVVRASRREHLLDLAANTNDIARTLLLDRDGPRLQGLRTKPWQTVLVREEGFADLAGGVSLISEGENLLIKNRSGRDLVGALVRVPSGTTTYFRRIKEGESVRASEGKALGALGGHSAPGALEASRFEAQLEADFPGLGHCWEAMERALANDSEWWPNDAPALLAALDGGEGKLTDSGLRVDYDRALVRVVGTGGTP
jgi:hypothetical protein